MSTKYVVQIDTSITGKAGDWADQGRGHEDWHGVETYYEETVADYPHRQVRMVKRVTTEEVLRRNHL